MKNLLSFCFMFLFISVFGQEGIKIDLNQENIPVKITSTKSTSFIVESQFSQVDFLNVNSKKDGFTEISIPGTYYSHQIGEPKLPQVKKLVEIPQEATISIHILSTEVEEYSLSDYGISQQVIPAQRSVSKSEDPDNIEFAYKQNTYTKNSFTATPLVKVEYVGQMRGVRFGRLVVSPVRYNPVTNTIKVYKNLKVSVKFEGADMAKTNQLKKATYSPFFENTFETASNYSQQNLKDGITRYPVKYVIVSDRMFESALEPFIKWKTKKGFKVITAYTDEIGKTTSAIKNYLKGLYDAGTASDPAPTYVLFVGDVDQIPSFDTKVDMDYHVTDLYYCEYTGDKIPEMYYGRFSANNVSELQPQIDKTLEYEQYLMPDPGFLNEAVLVAGADKNFAPTHGNGQINYGAKYYFNEEHNFNLHKYLYPESANSAQQIRNDIGKGCSFANYTAHCSPNGWAEPSFSISHISGLNNAHEYPLMIANCCRSSRFHENSFGEEILRAKDKGAVGYIGTSDYSYWDEDFYFGVGVGNITANPTYEGTSLGAYDCAFHEKGEPESKWFVTNGQVMMAGNLAVTEGGGSLVDYYWEIYHLMGDPSLMNYFSVPEALSVNHAESLPTGSSSLTINTEKHAYVAISKNGELLDAKYSGTGTQVTLSFDALYESGTADIVVTKQNRAPYIGTVNIAGDPAPPKAKFSASPTTLNAGGTVKFTDMSTNAPTTYSWSFEGGTPASSTEKNPSVVYNTTGTYNVSLTVSNSEGSDTAIKNGYITVDDTPLSYCESKGENAKHEWIAKVQIGDYTNSSGASMYTDFTSDSIIVSTGDTKVILTPEFNSKVYNEYWKIWIDLNRDGDFNDNNELVFDAGSMSSSAVSGNMNIPANANGVTTRMRVSMKFNGEQTACESFSYGEVEDYTVIISGERDSQAPTAPANLIASNITTTGANLSWDTSSDNVGVTGYEVYQNNSLIANTESTSYNVTGLSESTSYSFYVKAKDAAENVSGASNTINLTTNGQPVEYCSSKGKNSDYEWIAKVTIGDYTNTSGAAGHSDFTSETVSVGTGSTAVSFSPGFSNSTYDESWRVWIDLNKDGDFDDSGELMFAPNTLSPNVISGEIIIPASASGTTTRMRISMKYDGGQNACETFAYGEVEDYTVRIGDAKNSKGETLDIEVPDSKSFKIYPNPTTGMVNIELEENSNRANVKVLTPDSRMVDNFIMSTDHKTLDITNYKSGIYMIIIESSNKTEIIRLIKE